MSGLGIENRPPTTTDSTGKPGTVGKKGVTTGKKLATDPSTVATGRKMLQRLQPSAKNQTLLVGSDGVLRLGSSEKQEIKIYQDPKGPVTSTPEHKKPVSKQVQATVQSTSAETQVEESDTAQARADVLMYGKEEDLPIEYWKDLAEKRREALEVSLTENESLHNSVSQLEEEVERIKEEAEAYKSIAEQAHELANILKGIESDNEEEDAETSQTGSVGQQETSETNPSETSCNVDAEQH